MNDISEEYRQMLRQLHEENHPQRQPGEFTIAEYAEENGLTEKQAAAEMKYMLNNGKIERPPERYIDSHIKIVYKKKGD